jgi:hypothetical protein
LQSLLSLETICDCLFGLKSNLDFLLWTLAETIESDMAHTLAMEADNWACTRIPYMVVAKTADTVKTRVIQRLKTRAIQNFEP